MPSIQTFNDFMTSTGPAYLTSADQVINEAVKQDGHGIAYIEANLGNGNRVWVYEARHNHPEWLKETASA